MYIILLDGKWTQYNFTSYEIGIRHKSRSIYEVVDKKAFFLSILKYGILYKEEKCPV
jgi:hypothetical protein